MVIYQCIPEHQPEKKYMIIQVLACVTGKKKKDRRIKRYPVIRSSFIWAANLHWSLHGSDSALVRKRFGQTGSQQEQWVSQPQPQEGCSGVSPAAATCPGMNLSSALHTCLTTAHFPRPVYSAFALNSRSSVCLSSARMLNPSPAAKVLSSQSFQTLKLKF